MFRGLFFVSICCCFFSSTLPALAQCPSTGFGDLEIGVYFDEAGTLTSLDGVGPGLFLAYVVATVPAGMDLGEFGFSFSSNQAGLLLLDSDNSATQWMLNDWVFDEDPCHGEGQQVLATIQGFLTEPANDVTICLGPTSACFDTAPRYGPCGPGPELMFRPAYNGCAVVNPLAIEPPVPTVMTSWGTLKASFPD